MMEEKKNKTNSARKESSCKVVCEVVNNFTVVPAVWVFVCRRDGGKWSLS